MIQRVSRGSVSVDGTVRGSIEQGYVVLLGVRDGDTEADAKQLAGKTVNLRVFGDCDGKMNRSLRDVQGSVLAISQFTLYADTRKGNRPGFGKAARPEDARALYECYVQALRELLGPQQVATGVFQAMMSVEIINDGPVTVELNTDT